MIYESKTFNSYSEAIAFSEKVNGYIEGPFFDDNLKREYIVFYKTIRG